MDERSSSKWNSKRVEVEEIPVPKAKPKTIRLVLIRNTNLKIRGKTTGNDYFFSGAGSVLDVNEEDAQVFLAMRRNSCNCSGMPGLPYFEIVGG